jgi:3-oxoacyl-[acyl-carrier protein] reductase
MDLGLRDRVALVAASSRGLGKAIARGLAREGARLALCARTEPVLLKTADEIRRETGVEVLARAVDVTAPDEVRRFVADTAVHFGRLDICVANAGGPPSKSFADTTLEDWRQAAELNLMSTVSLARETLPLMRDRRWGRFIAITSVSVKQPLDNLVLSNSIRLGVIGLVKTLSNEYGPYNVLVNSVCPGFTATDRLLELGFQEAWVAQAPLRRIGRPEELANVVVFLASERASYVTGVALAVDGGLVKGL